MPKLNKRRRQVKELSNNRGKPDVGDEDEDDDEEDDGKTEEPQVQETQTVSVSKGTREKSKGSSSSSSSKGASSATPNGANPDDRDWVRCNTCDKWRALPCNVDPNNLPDIWTCKLNTYDPLRNNCDAPEEEYDIPDSQLRSFFKLWVKRVKCSDRFESRFPLSAGTRGRKRSRDVEWVRCCSPSCGKWRPVLRSVDISAMLRKLNKAKWGSKGGQWFCSMNSWDDTQASCAAPQEPLYDCPWNLSSLHFTNDI